MRYNGHLFGRSTLADELTRLSESLLDDFLWFLRFERNLTPNTVMAYEADLRQFVSFLKETRGRGARQCQRDDIVAFLELRMDKGTSVRTRARQLSALRRFYKRLLDEGEVEVDPTELLDPMKMPFVLPTVLTEEEVVRLIEKPDVQTPEGLRDRCILEFMYATGVRVTELCNLSLPQLQMGEQFAIIEGKGRKQRVVPITGEAIAWLEAYLGNARPKLLAAARRHHPDARAIVFVSRLGKRLTRQGVWKLVRKYSDEAGIREDVHPHVLRHCFATHLLLRGADLRVIQALLGHSNIATTEIYTHLDKKQLRDAYDSFHPRR